MPTTAWHMRMVVFIMELPEGMVNPVYAYLDKHKIAPGFILDKI